jgi:hypothetical protein
MSESPALLEYQNRFQNKKTAADRLSKKADRIGNIRLIFALVALLFILLPLWIRSSGPWWGLLPLFVIFGVIGKMHDVALDAMYRAKAAQRYAQRELSRLKEEWREFASDGTDLAPLDLAQAQFAADIDLYGPNSLFQLLNRTMTHHGSHTLATWMVEPADLPEVHARQEAVKILAEDIEFREAFSVAATGHDSSTLESDFLVEWAEKPKYLPRAKILGILAYVLPVSLALSVLLYVVTLQAMPLIVVAGLQVVFLMSLRSALATRSIAISGPDRVLHRFLDMINVFEAKSFDNERLTLLQSRLKGGQDSAVAQIRALSKIAQKLEARHNVFFALLIAPLVLWELHWVLKAENWQRETGPHLRAWLQTLGELEALCSLGAFAYERADYVMPELVSDVGVLELKNLAHPLLKRDEAVSNDITLGGPGSVLLLSGSNMSGKSTFLRALGLNQVLARMGAPVAATMMKSSAFVLATSIRVSDSLARGASHFYAELERIKQALDLGAAHHGAVLYLLDEMLHGTNSKERYIGAVSVIRWLSQAKAVGVVTTHDLALAKVESLVPQGLVTNMHFGDDIEEDEIQFDYTLKLGPVVTTNALRLMKAVGIDVEMIGTDKDDSV